MIEWKEEGRYKAEWGDQISRILFAHRHLSCLSFFSKIPFVSVVFRIVKGWKMQQHPVPQNITGFEFKLVGFLTIKQFGYLAAAGVVSFIIYIIFPGIISWLLIIPLTALSLALAFVKISGLNFDRWLVALFYALTKPPQRVWRKESKTFSFLQPEFSYYLKRSPVALGEVKDRTRLEAFLSQVDGGGNPNRKLDAIETTRLSQLDFGTEKILDLPSGGGASSLPVAGPDTNMHSIQEVVGGRQNG